MGMWKQIEIVPACQSAFIFPGHFRAQWQTKLHSESQVYKKTNLNADDVIIL